MIARKSPARKAGAKTTKSAAARPSTPIARFRMRVMSGDTISVGPGKIALLEAIRTERSITAAAQSIGMSYRRAWMLVDELNAMLRKAAVRSIKGGDHGGGSELTEEGEMLVAVYRRIEAQATEACASEIKTLLKMVR